MAAKKRNPRPTIKVSVTDENLEAANNLASKMGCSLAEIVRQDLKARCDLYGVTWGKDIASHGGYRGKSKDAT